MRTDRKADQLRPVSIECGVVKNADGSAIIRMGDTHVLCTAKLVPGVPNWLRGARRGWLTAEYSLLPASTTTRTPREATQGRQGGRTMEIQRLIGRSLRAVTDLASLGERTIYIDCDVLQADGGTRTASISGAYVALYLALAKMGRAEGMGDLPLFDSVAAVSVGLVRRPHAPGPGLRRGRGGWGGYEHRAHRQWQAHRSASDRRRRPVRPRRLRSTARLGRCRLSVGLRAADADGRRARSPGVVTQCA